MLPQEDKPLAKEKHDIIFKPTQKQQEVMEEKPLPEETKKKASPKIQVLSEEDDYQSMVVGRTVTKELIDMSIEVEAVESLKELDLVISDKDLKLYKVDSKK